MSYLLFGGLFFWSVHWCQHIYGEISAMDHAASGSLKHRLTSHTFINSQCGTHYFLNTAKIDDMCDFAL